MNDFLATVPFDLYELSLFHLVAEHGSFTKAGLKAGLTQSAMTRQIRGVEVQLGTQLFERTTRHVSLTPAGKMLYDRSKPILAAAEDTLTQLQQDFHLAPRTLRVGVARSIGLAYYPGFFFAFRQRHPEVRLSVVQLGGQEILDAVENRTLDAGLLSPPRKLPASLSITNEFDDDFLLVAPSTSTLADTSGPITVRSLRKRLIQERWLLLNPQEESGRQLRSWMSRQGLDIEPAMELDGFDVIVNLVALGLGVSLVPHRVLALYGQRRKIHRISLKPRFNRKLGVVVRRNRNQPEPLASFIESILF
jgi:DNA-binding transcriptional LysR family regulator